MRNIAALSLLMFVSSGCAYYPDLYSVDTTDLRQRAIPLSGDGTKIYTEVVKKKLACEGDAEESPCREVLSSEEVVIDQLSRFERSILAVSELQDDYEKRYKEVGAIDDLLQLPILVAAGVTGLILIEGGAFSGENRTRRAAEIGVLATTYAAGRDALTSSDMAEFYIKGHSALNCTIAYGLNFSAVQSTSPYKRLDAALRAQLVSIGVLERLLGLNPTDNVTENLKTARGLADTALTLARATRKGALAELVAAERASLEFDLEASEISVLVATQGQSRSSANFDTITAAFQNSGEGNEEAAGTGADEPVSDAETAEETEKAHDVTPNTLFSNGKTSDEIAADINKQIQRLRTTSASLEGASPDYKTRLNEMKACSAIVTS